MSVFNNDAQKKTSNDRTQKKQLTVTHFANGVKVPEELLSECVIDNPVIEGLIAQATNIHKEKNYE
jgi:hypothetical protein